MRMKFLALCLVGKCRARRDGAKLPDDSGMPRSSLAQRRCSHRQKNQTGQLPRTVSYLEITETVTLISDTPRILTFVPDTRRKKSSSP